ncbi:MAG: phytanoyl-CoA dioxygenase family protein [Acidimicrobiia bacterium]|nr:phytanoyl-CoA dioxygenase family protein [Acidimicrobiia bacterium]
MDAQRVAGLWRRDGFASIEDLVDAAGLAQFATLVDDLVTRVDELPPANVHHRRAADGSTLSLEIEWTTQLQPALAATVALRSCRALAAEAFGAEPELFFDHIIHKPARTGSGTAWHQDAVYDRFEPDRDRVHFWIPTASVAIDGGCMEFVPASHLGDVAEHRPSADDPEGHVRVAAVDDPAAVPVPLPAGGATLHHQRAMHRTGPNRSGVARTAWILQFARPRRPSERAANQFRRAARLGRRLSARTAAVS